MSASLESAFHIIPQLEASLEPTSTAAWIERAKSLASVNVEALIHTHTSFGATTPYGDQVIFRIEKSSETVEEEQRITFHLRVTQDSQHRATEVIFVTGKNPMAPMIILPSGEAITWEELQDLRYKGLHVYLARIGNIFDYISAAETLQDRDISSSLFLLGHIGHLAESATLLRASEFTNDDIRQIHERIREHDISIALRQLEYVAAAQLDTLDLPIEERPYHTSIGIPTLKVSTVPTITTEFRTTEKGSDQVLPAFIMDTIFVPGYTPRVSLGLRLIGADGKPRLYELGPEQVQTTEMKLFLELARIQALHQILSIPIQATSNEIARGLQGIITTLEILLQHNTTARRPS